MDAKTKAKVQGILIGSGLVAFLIFFDKTYGPNAVSYTHLTLPTNREV